MPLSERHIQLLHRLLDGETSFLERWRVHRLLNASEEARASFQELKMLKERLTRLKEIDVPPSFQAQTVERIRSVQQVPARSVLQPRPLQAAVRFAFVFLLGAFSGIVVWQLIVGGDIPDEGNLAGTFFPSRTDRGVLLDFDSINVAGTFGIVRAWKSGDSVVIGADVITSEKTKLTLEYEPAELRYSAFSAETDHSSSLTSDSGSVVFYTEQYGEYLISFKKKGLHATQMDFTVCHEGTCLYHGILSLVEPVAMKSTKK